VLTLLGAMISLGVPCILIDSNNIQKWWSHITDCLSHSDYLAIDLVSQFLFSLSLLISIFSPGIVRTGIERFILNVSIIAQISSRKAIFSTFRQIDERYKALKEVASTRAILSMGLACFKINSNKGIFDRKKSKNNLEKAAFDQIHDCIDQSLDSGISTDDEDEDFHITVTVFDFLCLCNEYVIESKSMKFLVQQGFDFNEHASNGIPFVRGNDMVGVLDCITHLLLLTSCFLLLLL